MDENLNDVRVQVKEKDQAEALETATCEVEAEHFTVASFSEEEAAAYAPLLEDFTQIIRGIEMREAIGDEAVLRAGEEK